MSSRRIFTRSKIEVSKSRVLKMCTFKLFKLNLFIFSSTNACVYILRRHDIGGFSPADKNIFKYYKFQRIISQNAEK